jgi:hypothetical protein
VDPVVLAHLEADDQVRDLAGAEEQVGAEGHRLAAQVARRARGHVGARAEPAGLLELAVVGRNDLGTSPRTRPPCIAAATL